MSRNFWLVFYATIGIIGEIGALGGLYIGNLFNVLIGVTVYFVNIYWLYKEYMKFPEVV